MLPCECLVSTKVSGYLDIIYLALKASAAKTMELVQLLNDNGDNHYSTCGEYEDGD